MADAFELKGIDDFTGLFRAVENLETSANVDVDVDTFNTGSREEFEDLPAFSHNNYWYYWPPYMKTDNGFLHGDSHLFKSCIFHFFLTL